MQAFSSSAENEKQSTNSMGVSSLVLEGNSMEAYNISKPPIQDVKLSEGGRPVSQDSEVTSNDSEGKVPPKKPVVQSDNKDGPTQAVAINGKGFTNV